MAGIQVHTSSPINTNTGSKTQETTEAPTSTRGTPAYAPATTTSAYDPSASQSAQPGAAPVPAPSAAAKAYAPPSPTRTTTAVEATNPPPPQPGQVPQPFAEHSSTIPPPPQPSGSTQTLQEIASSPQTQASPTQYPHPPPVSSVQWTSSYAYAQPPAGTTSVAQDLSHPPGYVQDNHSFNDRYTEPGITNNTNSPTLGRGLLEDPSQFHNNSGDESNQIWDTAMSWAKEAGRKLSAVEGEVWKKINGEK